MLCSAWEIQTVNPNLQSLNNKTMNSKTYFITYINTLTLTAKENDYFN